MGWWIMTKLWNFIKRIFRKDLPTVPEEVIQDTMRMIRRNITLENRERLKQAFERLTPHATRIVMERLDKVERRQLVKLLG